MDKRTYTNEYRNGQTQPQKSSGGLIAFLLICIIFLCGVISMLGLLNIHLFRQIQQAATDKPLSFAEGEIAPAYKEAETLTVAGITVQEMPAMYQQLYELPAGLYVVDASEDCPILPGDVLVSFGDTDLRTLADLNAALLLCENGDQILLTFCRDRETFSYTTVFEY